MCKKRMKAVCIFITIMTMVTAVSGCHKTVFQPEEQVFTVTYQSINKHGTVILNTTFDEMKEHDMEIGDIITVTIGENTYDFPVGTAYSDVDTGKMICRFDQEDNEVGLAINMGSFASETGIGEKQTIEADPGFQWDVRISEVSLVLKEKAGYIDEYRVRNLTRSNNREDYPELTDEEYANFRAVKAASLKENMLYRSSTPIEQAIGRNEYAMSAMEKAGIRSVLNLDDSVETMESYETFPGSYYSGCVIANPEMTYDFGSEEFAEKVRQSIVFITENEGPYLIHCKEGKDRTGILCALLECYLGASEQEIIDDYMITYANFYGIKSDDAAYNIILKTNLFKTLCGIYHIDQFDGADLKKLAIEYFTSIGVTKQQMDLLSEKLGTE